METSGQSALDWEGEGGRERLTDRRVLAAYTYLIGNGTLAPMRAPLEA